MTIETFTPAASVGSGIVHALRLSFGMTWEILWVLIVGFTLSAVVESVVSKAEMRRLLPTTVRGPRRRLWPRRRFRLVLLRSRRPGPVAVPEGCQLHLVDGVRDHDHRAEHSVQQRRRALSDRVLVIGGYHAK
jgi:hypothetical protein